MTAQEIIDSFKHQRASYRQLRADRMARVLAVDDTDNRIYLWDDMRKHIAYYLDAVDAKRETITDEQLAEATKGEL